MDDNAAVQWLREQVEANLSWWRGRGSNLRYYAFTEDRGTAADLDLAEDVIAQCEAQLAILDFHRTVLYPPMGHMCDACSQPAPCRTIRLLASGYRHRGGWAEHWDDGGR